MGPTVQNRFTVPICKEKRIVITNWVHEVKFKQETDINLVSSSSISKPPPFKRRGPTIIKQLYNH